MVGLLCVAEDLGGLDIRPAGVLGDAVGDIDSEPVCPSVEPESQDREELGSDLRVFPVQVGLARVKQVEIPLAVVGARPGRTSKDGSPIRGGLVAVVDEVETVSFGASRFGGERSLEPFVVPRAVVWDEVDEHLDAQLVCLSDHRFGVRERAEVGMDVSVVGDVIAAVEQRRRVPRVDPDAVDAEVGEVGKLGPKSGNITGTVAVPIGE